MNLRPTTIIGLAQVGVLIVSFLVTCAFMKAGGYEEYGRPWPYVCLSLRHWIFWWLLLPILWTVAASIADQRGDFLRISRRHYFTAGLVLLAFLSLHGLGAIVCALIGPPHSVVSLESFSS